MRLGMRERTGPWVAAGAPVAAGAVGHGSHGVDIAAAALRGQCDDGLGLGLAGEFLGVGLQLSGDRGEVRAVGRGLCLIESDVDDDSASGLRRGTTPAGP